MKKKIQSTFPTTRLTLLQNLRGQQADSAWRTFFDVYGPLVYAMARRSGLQEQDSEEVLANVMRSFVHSVQRGFEVNHEIGLFRSYLRKITNREISAGRRRRTGGASVGSVDTQDVAADETTPDEHWAALERQERLWLCWERLRESRSVGPRDLQAFQDLVLRGDPHKKVAARYGITVNRLYGIKHSMLQRLRRMRHKLDLELGEV